MRQPLHHQKLVWLPFAVLLLIALNRAALPASDWLQAKEGPAIHLIGHAHIDPVWRWTKDEGRAEVLAMFRSAVARLKEYPEAAFIASSAQFYQWAKEADPGLFDQIKALVKEGRWNPVGGWWVEADVNCPLGESLVRQGLYGQLFFVESFGRKMRVGFNPDAFGHPWTLPQILGGQGLAAYFFMRPGPHEKADLRTPLFLWQGADGTKIPAVQILGSYNGDERSLEARVKETGLYFAQNQPDQKSWVVFYGVGDHGGGPTKAAIEKIQNMQRVDPRIRFSTLDRYLSAIGPGLKGLPVVSGELQHHARGCYSACASIKALNRESEWALLTAEKLAALDTSLLGKEYPVEPFRQSWEKVLFNQFHDILAGSAIEEAYRDARNDYGYALSAAREISIRSLQNIAQKVSTEAAPNAMCSPFLVFNPQSWRVREPVEVEVERLGDRPPRLIRHDGKQVAYQEIRTAGVKVTAWSHHTPQTLDEREGMRLMDTGVHEFSYALLPHPGDWRDADIARRAESFGMKPLAVLTDRHPGPWPGREEFLAISSPHVAVTVLKMAEKEEALILRLVELSGQETAGEVRTVLADKPIPYRLRPCEIKTILLPLDRKKLPREVSLIEGT